MLFFFKYCFLTYLLNDIMGTYNKIQIEYRENLKNRIQRQLEISEYTIRQFLLL